MYPIDTKIIQNTNIIKYYTNCLQNEMSDSDFLELFINKITGFRFHSVLNRINFDIDGNLPSKNFNIIEYKKIVFDDISELIATLPVPSEINKYIMDTYISSPVLINGEKSLAKIVYDKLDLNNESFMEDDWDDDNYGRFYVFFSLAKTKK